jgi:hypothetical protein
MHAAAIYYNNIEFPNVEYKPEQTKTEKTVDLNFGASVTDNESTQENSEGEENKKEETKTEEAQKQLSDLKIGSKTEENSKAYLIMMGGRYIDQFSQEILCLDLDTWEWKYLGSMPVKLCAHASDIAGDRIFLFGGTDGIQFLDTLYCFEIPSKKWYIYSEKTKNVLLPRIAASISYNPDNNELLLFGGLSYENDINDLNFLSLSNENCAKLFQKL